MTALPVAPSRNDITTFADRGDALMAALPGFVTEANALEANVVAKEASATASAAAATSAASAVTAYRNAAVWAAATPYALHSTAFSPIDQRVYRRVIAGTTPTDPSADATNWSPVDIGFRVAVVTLTTQAAVANTHYVLTNVGTTTVTLPASPLSGDAIWVTGANSLENNVIARNGQTIMTLAEDFTVDRAGITLQLRFVNNDWKII